MNLYLNFLNTTKFLTSHSFHIQFGDIRKTNITIQCIALMVMNENCKTSQEISFSFISFKTFHCISMFALGIFQH